MRQRSIIQQKSILTMITRENKVKKINLNLCFMLMLFAVSFIVPTKKAEAGVVLIASTGIFGGALWPIAMVAGGAMILDFGDKLFEESKGKQRLFGYGLLLLGNSDAKKVRKAFVKNIVPCLTKNYELSEEEAIKAAGISSINLAIGMNGQIYVNDDFEYIACLQ